MLIQLFDSNNDPRQLRYACDVLEDGGVVILPTGSTYAPACHALKERGAERLAAFCNHAGSELGNTPFTLVCEDLSMMDCYARIDNATFRLIKRNIREAITFVLPSQGKLPRALGKRGGEVGLQLPRCGQMEELIRELGAPLLVGTLPLSEDEYDCCRDASLCEETFGSRADLVIDGGEPRKSPTTVVRLTEEGVEVIRQSEAVFTT